MLNNVDKTKSNFFVKNGRYMRHNVEKMKSKISIDWKLQVFLILNKILSRYFIM